MDSVEKSNEIAYLVYLIELAIKPCEPNHLFM